MKADAEKREDGQAQPGHTPEPWEISGYGNQIWQSNSAVVHTCDDQAPDCECAQPVVIHWIDKDEDARRIVAAVNACAGLSTEALESGVVQEMVEAAKWAVMEWRLHGQLTDSCRHLEAALSKVGER